MNYFLKRQSIEEPLINLTPLIDVVFVILIMFIVIAPLLELDRIELAESGKTPLPNSLAVQEASPISIYVHQDNSVWFHNQQVNQEQLFQMLIKDKEQYPNATPQLFHDRQALFGTYQWIKNCVEAAGFQQMDIILKPT